MPVDGHISAIDYPASLSFGGLDAHEGIRFAPAKRVGRAAGRRRWGLLADFDPKNRGRFQTEAVLRIFGGQSLLRQTLERIGPIFRADRTMFVVTKAHERFYQEDLRRTDHSRILAQPQNRGHQMQRLG